MRRQIVCVLPFRASSVVYGQSKHSLGRFGEQWTKKSTDNEIFCYIIVNRTTHHSCSALHSPNAHSDPRLFSRPTFSHIFISFLPACLCVGHKLEFIERTIQKHSAVLAVSNVSTQHASEPLCGSPIRHCAMLGQLPFAMRLNQTNFPICHCKLVKNKPNNSFRFEAECLWATE